jgi:hypothetical protein
MRPICQCGNCPYCTGRPKAWKDKTPAEKQAVLDRRNPERVRANDRRRYERDKKKRRAAMAAYQATPEGKEAHNRAAREWAARNYEKRRAHIAVGNALRDGRLVKGPCEIGEGCQGRVEAHHDDYSKPLEVRWFCSRHHHNQHNEF